MLKKWNHSSSSTYSSRVCRKTWNISAFESPCKNAEYKHIFMCKPCVKQQFEKVIFPYGLFAIVNNITVIVKTVGYTCFSATSITTEIFAKNADFELLTCVFVIFSPVLQINLLEKEFIFNKQLVIMLKIRILSVLHWCDNQCFFRCYNILKNKHFLQLNKLMQDFQPSILASILYACGIVHTNFNSKRNSYR